MIVGLIGCGNIGREIALFLQRSSFFHLKYIHDIVPTDSFINELRLLGKIQVAKIQAVGFDELVEKSELIIEAASKEAVNLLFQKNLDNKKVMILSTGGLLGKEFRHLNIIIPSGAVAGIDALKAVAGQIDMIRLVTTKSPQSLQGAPYVLEKNIDLYSIKEKKTIFSGLLAAAIQGFPRNVNVAATISLAVNKDITVEVVVDPNIKTNTHNILCSGSFGTMNLLVENKPSKNPKTSQLAVLSAIQTLRNIESSARIGT